MLSLSSLQAQAAGRHGTGLPIMSSSLSWQLPPSRLRVHIFLLLQPLTGPQHGPPGHRKAVAPKSSPDMSFVRVAACAGSLERCTCKLVLDTCLRR